MNIHQAVSQLVQYGMDTRLIGREDEVYLTNLLFDLFHIDGPAEPAEGKAPLEDILQTMLDYAAETGILEENNTVGRDLFDTRIMGLLTPRPSEVIREFYDLYLKKSPKAATDYFFRLCEDCDYIRRYRIRRDQKWTVSTEYGKMDITINLSKPEKDPKAIAAALKAKQSGYPACLLCRENEGYAGRMNHPARQNHRLIPIELDGEDYFLQYSPYVYYNEHCIVLNQEHIPMKIDRSTFAKLLDFVSQFNHYFLGSNADLPIVGGSILTHDHFQGGNYEFAMAKAPIETEFRFGDRVYGGIVKWPMSVIRLYSTDRDALIDKADHILQSWRGYSDPSVQIFADKGGEPHNTITPIARYRNYQYELDLVLRNNLTTEKYPLGLYHPHPEHHHIKKENIGLIEVMGLAILPARLATEIDLMEDCLLNDKNPDAVPGLEQHAAWLKQLQAKYSAFRKESVRNTICREIGLVFVEILEQAGVYKRTPEGQAAFLRFLNQL